MKFQYKFESIKKIKETLEKKAQKELAEVEMHLERCKIEIEKLDNIIKALRIDVSGQKSVRVSEMHHLGRYEEYLKSEKKVLENNMDELVILREAKLEELKTKQKEFKMFETMEEKHLADFLLTSNHAEQITIDEIANQKFARGNL